MASKSLRSLALCWLALMVLLFAGAGIWGAVDPQGSPGFLSWVVELWPTGTWVLLIPPGLALLWANRIDGKHLYDDLAGTPDEADGA